MNRVLLVIGYQQSKLQFLKKKERIKLEEFLLKNYEAYDGVISIIRDKSDAQGMMKHKELQEAAQDSEAYYPIPIGKTVTVAGYDIDTTGMRKDTIYDIVGVSTAASILCMAMSLFSAGYRIRVLSDFCFDRKGLHDEAIAIMTEYMPGSVV